MKKAIAFILGILAGWSLKVLIDTYREPSLSEVEQAATTRGGPTIEKERAAVGTRARDDLKVIKGIGPVIERKLNEGGIRTFAQLGKLTAEDLKGILGKSIQRLADEEALLEQARELARKK